MTLPAAPPDAEPGNPMTGAAVAGTLRRLRERAPLVHNITNLVVTNSTANALLAVGASPAMVEAVEEVAEFAHVADALVINLGTMNADRAAAMPLAAAAAREAGTPWVLDPVAVGALAFRSRVAVELLAHAPQAIRGNASEILALEALSAGSAGVPASGRGVDSAHAAEAALDSARRLAVRTGAVVTVSGATDLITDGHQVIGVTNGHAMMQRVTGLGCTATALIGACLAVQPDALVASVHGMVLIGLAGEIAAAQATGPGSLQVGLLDALYRLDDATLRSGAAILERNTIAADPT